MLIENELYDKIREVLPTVCVDLLVTNEQKQYLLAKRTEKPAKGSWWFPGGRIHKGETWQECAKRKGKEELGIDLPIGNLISVENYFAGISPPNLVAPNGTTLTPELVQSFTQSEMQYAESGGAMNDASPIGAVQEISGEVTVIRTNGIVESASIGTPIYQGDVIETNESGAVNILFMDETTFAISEDARLAIDEYVLLNNFNLKILNSRFAEISDNSTKN